MESNEQIELQNQSEQDISIYSDVSSETNVSFNEIAQKLGVTEDDIRTAIGSLTEEDLKTALENVAGELSSLSDLDISVYSAKPSETDCVIEEDLSWYESPPSETEVEMPFSSFKVGNLTVSDSIECLHNLDSATLVPAGIPIKPAEYNGAGLPAMLAKITPEIALNAKNDVTTARENAGVSVQ